MGEAERPYPRRLDTELAVGKRCRGQNARALGCREEAIESENPCKNFEPVVPRVHHFVG